MTNDRPNWHGRPYYSLDSYLKNTYGEKIYKIALNAGFTCPNRDGSLDTRGCIFCSAGGSGEYAVPMEGKSIDRQLEEGLRLFHGKKTGNRFIAYFQAYTNTYAPAEQLRLLYSRALSHAQIAGISIATRPDCLPFEVLSLLAELRTQYPDKFIWIELGLQTIHEDSAAFIRRGYPLAVFENAVEQLNQLSIPVIVHVILGLPGEDLQRMLETICYLNHRNIWGIKLQLLNILKGTDLAGLYEQNAIETYTLDTYIDVLATCIAHLDEHIVIHRLTGDGPKDLLLAPLFCADKRHVLNTLHRELKARGIRQGMAVNNMRKETQHDAGAIYNL